jgi:VWFA-related protein
MPISSPAFSPKFWAKISCVLLSSAVWGQETTFRASTELVVVDVLVEHKKTGLPIRALTRDDFEVYEDRVRQPVTQFSLDTVPLSIVFLFDMTDSVRPVLKPLAEGALASLHHLKPEDEIAVMLYAERADLTQDFTRDHDLVARAIESASAMRPNHCGPKPELCSQAAYFNEGIFQSATRAYKVGNPSNRRVIIWLTDNVPNVPDGRVHSEAATMGLLHESGVVVCALLERSSMSNEMGVVYSHDPMFMPMRMLHPPGDVNQYAAETGGVVVGARREEISTKLADLIDRIRGRYTVGYRPAAQKPEGTLCKIQVKLSREALARIGAKENAVDVRARRGYTRSFGSTRFLGLR